MAGRHIRYNVAGKYFEWSETGTAQGPWTKLDLSAHSATMPTNVAYVDVSNIFTQNQNINRIRPELDLFFTGDTVKTRALMAVADGALYLSSNLWYNGTNWMRDDIAKTSSLMALRSDGSYQIYKSAAGANPVSALTQIYGMDAAGAVTLFSSAGNVARKDINNNFVPQDFATASSITGTNSILNLYATSGAVNNKRWRIINYADGLLRFEKLSDDAASVITTAYFDTVGNMVISGLLHVGGGIVRFPAVANSASANDLDDYEEGTWSPTFSASGGGYITAYGIRSGRYTKIGNVVTATFEVQVNAAAWAGGEYLYFSGMPFVTDAANVGGGFWLSDWSQLNPPLIMMHLYVYPGGALGHINMKTQSGSTATDGAMTCVVVSSGALWRGTIQYRTPT